MNYWDDAPRTKAWSAADLFLLWHERTGHDDWADLDTVVCRECKAEATAVGLICWPWCNGDESDLYFRLKNGKKIKAGKGLFETIASWPANWRATATKKEN